MAVSVPPGLVDVGRPLLERIVLLADENPAARLVCKQWRDIVDYSDTPFWLRYDGNTKPVALLVLRRPWDSAAIQGCLSWCRRNGHRHDAVELRSSSSWWFLPAAPLCHLSNATKMRFSWAHLPEENSLAVLSPFTRLQDLELSNVSAVREQSLQPLTCLGALRHLALMNCRLKVLDLKTVGQLTDLTSLSLFDGEYEDMHDAGLDDLCKLTGLQSLTTDILSIQGISNLVSLTKFDWRVCDRDEWEMHEDEGDIREHMLELNCLSKLRELHLWQAADSYMDVLQSSSVTSLELSCAFGSDPCFVAQLKGVSNVRQLSLQHCDLVDLSGLSAMKDLEVLDVTNNERVASEIMLDANTLTGLTMLKVLHLASSDVCKPAVDLSLLKNAGVQIILDKPLWSCPVVVG